MAELLHYTFFQHALIATILVGIVCGVVGTYIVARRMVFISGGITHASFGGLGIAWYLGFPPLAGAALFSVASALGIHWLSRRQRIREDSLIGIFWSAGMAIGILFIYLTPGYAPDLITYLFGNVLTVTRPQIWVILGFAGVTLLFFALFSRPLFYMAFDREYARTHTFPASVPEIGVTLLIALTIVLSMKLAGIILIISYLTIPQAIASLFSKDFKRQLRIAPLVCVLVSVAGLFLSALLNIPSGAVIVACLLFVYIFLWLLRRLGFFV